MFEVRVFSRNTNTSILDMTLATWSGTAVAWKTPGGNAAIEFEETAADVGNAWMEESDKLCVSAECEAREAPSICGRTGRGFTWSPMDEEERELCVQTVFCEGSGLGVN